MSHHEGIGCARPWRAWSIAAVLLGLVASSAVLGCYNQLVEFPLVYDLGAADLHREHPDLGTDQAAPADLSTDDGPSSD